MKAGKLVRIVGWVMLIALIVIQFIPIDKSVPEVDPGQDFLNSYEMPQEFVTLVREACYDCHSYEAEYPWYAKIAPVKFWIQDHIEHGRGHLNYSIWGTYEIDRKIHKLEEMAEEVGEGHMPLNSFTWMHPEARLTDDQRTKLVGWFEALSH